MPTSPQIWTHLKGALGIRQQHVLLGDIFKTQNQNVSQKVQLTVLWV